MRVRNETGSVARMVVRKKFRFQSRYGLLIYGMKFTRSFGMTNVFSHTRYQLHTAAGIYKSHTRSIHTIGMKLVGMKIILFWYELHTVQKGQSSDHLTCASKQSFKQMGVSRCVRRSELMLDLCLFSPHNGRR